MKFKITAYIAITGLVMSSPLYAAEKTLPVDVFNRLVVSKGVVAEVICGETPQVVVSGKQYLLDKLQLNVSNSTLSLVNDGYRDEGIWPDKLAVKIYTVQPLQSVEAISGVSLSAGACSLAANHLRVKGSMGVSYAISGNVKDLNLDISMGSDFNSDVNDLYANAANISLTTGGRANLCNIDTVDGNLTMGSGVILGKNTKSHLSFSMGGYSSRSDCQ